ncbi:MAG: hypothetical protein M3281_03870 [Chloroflexota bacterium]|nr:hypothetical protein [Chloroflexota bacterium]
MGRRVAVLWLGVLLAILSGLAGPSAYGAAGQGVIEGKVTVGTPGGKLGARTEVVLYSARGQEQLPERKASADPQGRFRFEGLPVGNEYGYVVANRRQSIWYNTGRIALTSAQPRQQVVLEVFDSSPDDSKLRMASASLMFMQVDKVTQSISVLETFMVENPTKTTFQPTTEGPRGPMGLLRFSLPPDASAIRAMGELSSREVIRIDRGFATDLPVRPGQNEITFTYQIPYRDEAGTYSFERTMPYPTEKFRLLVAKDGPKVTSPDLKADQPAPLWGDLYTVLAADNLPARSRVEVNISGLPVNTYPLSPDNRWLWVASAVGLLVLLGTALWLWRRGVRGQATPAEAVSASGEAEQLIHAIAALDAEYEAGRLAETTYRRERDLRKQRLLGLVASG